MDRKLTILIVAPSYNKKDDHGPEIDDFNSGTQLQ